eukprot:710169-Pyramimonas_sp.AAC.1
MLPETLSFDSEHSYACKELYEVPGGDQVDGSPPALVIDSANTFTQGGHTRMIQPTPDIGRRGVIERVEDISVRQVCRFPFSPVGSMLTYMFDASRDFVCTTMYLVELFVIDELEEFRRGVEL